MVKMYKVSLTDAVRLLLQQTVSRGKTLARTITCVRNLLKADESEDGPGNAEQSHATPIEATQKETDLAVLVWDRAPSHRDATVQAMGLPLIEQPPGTRLRVSPELNPVERVFEYLQGQIEGGVYPTVGDKVAAVEAISEELDAHPERVQALTHWRWIADTLVQLPEKHAA